MLGEIKHWKEAGKIAAKVREELKSMVEPGVPILKICEKGEERIKDLGGKPAFPLNVSQNEIAAHYTSPPKDGRKIREGVVKIDVGAQKDGFIGDTAVTLPVGDVQEKVKKGLQAIEGILDYTLAAFKEGVRVKTISKRIKSKAHELGFGVVRDLNGHQITRGKLHGKISIPSDPSSLNRNWKVEKGDVIAVEPFIAVGSKDGETRSRRDLLPIYAAKSETSTQSSFNSFLEEIITRFDTLPFAARWLTNGRSDKEVVRELTKLVRKGLLEVYPVLEEKRKRFVIQKEHTVFVQEDSAEILTKYEEGRISSNCR